MGPDTDANSKRLLEFAWSEEDLIKIPEFEQPDGLEITLLPYQRQGLHWMLSCEDPKLPQNDDDEPVQFWKMDHSAGIPGKYTIFIRHPFV